MNGSMSRMNEEGLFPDMFDRISVFVTTRRSIDDDRKREVLIEGLFMGSDGDPGNEIISIKLDNGYNIGINFRRLINMRIVEKAKAGPTEPSQNPNIEIDGSIALLSTGGTIAARVDYSTGAVSPAVQPQDLLSDIAASTSGVKIYPKIVGSLLSEDMMPTDWTNIAREVVQAFSKGAIGCVITHGTDTITMSAIALSFLLKDLPGPVILVGSQRSSDRPSSDSFINLRDALLSARIKEIAEVMVLMHGSISDDQTYLHRGTLVRKMHTSRRDSFESVNSGPVGKVVDGKFVELRPIKRPSGKGIRSVGGFVEDVIVLRATPQMDRSLLVHAGNNYRALVIEGTGLGHIRSDLIDDIRGIVGKGIPVVITSSCPYGMVNLNVYSTGRELLKAGVVPGQDMGTETAMIKTMYVLDQMGREGGEFKMDWFRELFLTNISGELNMRTDISSFGSLKADCSINMIDSEEDRH